MNGKELKVVEYNLTFGSKARMVNVFGLFKYTKNNGLYVIYADVGTTYNVVNYATSHVKGDSILAMTPKDTDAEIIKEYIFKVTNGEKLDGFEILSLDEVNGIEIIASDRLEVKPEVLVSLIDKTIPKKEVVVPEKKKDIKKKKSPAKTLLVFIIFLALLAGGAYYYLTIATQNSDAKMLLCKKSSNDNSINAKIEESMNQSFSRNDELDSIETTKVFVFNSSEDYEDFINKGTMYKYMPDDEDGGYKKDDNAHTFTIIINEKVGQSYDKPTKYEEVLSYNKREGYTCDEKILEE